MINKAFVITFFHAFADTDFKKIFGVLIAEIFQNALLFYLLLNLLEYYQPGSVTRYFPLNLLLLLVLVFGLLTALYPKVFLEEIKQNNQIRKYFYLFLLFIVFNLLLINKIKGLGSIALIIAIFSLIFSLSVVLFLVFEINNEDRHE
ncbi:MAG: hypothetical protein WCT08_01830 [Patescibacteria group bacterium]|jgi:hypothetical protein